MKLFSCLVSIVLVLSSCGMRPTAKWPGHLKSEFLYQCWHKGDATLTAPARECRTGEEPSLLEWDELPLEVLTDGFTAGGAYMAIEVWNEWLGFEAFVVSKDGVDPDVVMIYGGQEGPTSDNGEQSAAVTFFEQRISDGKQHAVVAVFGNAVRDPEVYLHELGHALGLEHDKDNPRSIMSRSINDMFSPKLEKQDREALRSRYLHGRKTL